MASPSPGAASGRVCITSAWSVFSATLAFCLKCRNITAVSGGSGVAAHLALNWDRYNGSATEFDSAASESLSFVETAEMTRWLLLPKGREYRSFRVVRYKTAKPDKVEPVKLVTQYLAEDSTILAYKLLSVDPGYTYALTWYYK